VIEHLPMLLTLRDGIVTTTNALEVLRRAGVIVTV
jgi:hypothetical protein